MFSLICSLLYVTIYNNNILVSWGPVKVCVVYRTNISWCWYRVRTQQLSNDASCPLSLSQERKLCAFPIIEICSSDIINYMVPLSRQTDFFVPEMKEEVKTDVKEEDSDEDRGTDITGKYCLSRPFQPNTVVTAKPSLANKWQHQPKRSLTI